MQIIEMTLLWFGEFFFNVLLHKLQVNCYDKFKKPLVRFEHLTVCLQGPRKQEESKKFLSEIWGDRVRDFFEILLVCNVTLSLLNTFRKFETP